MTLLKWHVRSLMKQNIFEAIIEGFNEAEGTNLKLSDISNLEQAQG